MTGSTDTTDTTDATDATDTTAAEQLPPEFDKPPANPIALFREWFDNAVERGVREPGVVALATADSSGRPSNRIIQTLSITDVGLIFTSHTNSVKGREIEANGWASGLLYWRETKQQVQLSGAVVQLPDHRSDELWAARPTFTHAMSVASLQSEPLEDEEALRTEAVRLAALDKPLPRPSRWVGYQLVPSMVEFWHSMPDRLYGRLRYDHTAEGWTSRRLQP